MGWSAGLMGRLAIFGAIFALASSVGGCLLLPSSGPNSLDVSAGASRSGINYAVIKLTPGVVKTMAEYGPLTISGVFGDKRPPPEIKFGIGDVISVSIFEAAAGGLFIPSEAGGRPGTFWALPGETGEHQRVI